MISFIVPGDKLKYFLFKFKNNIQELNEDNAKLFSNQGERFG